MNVHRYLLMLVLLPALACAEPTTDCPASDGVSLQVLGSGGPIADDARASTGYLVWIDGRARAMIDAGGGTFLRFGEAGAKFTDLEIIAISHFHTDHSADLPALLKSGYFTDRSEPLVVSGPNGDPPFPGLLEFTDEMLNGAYAYLGGYLDGSGGLPKLERVEVSGDEVAQVLQHGSLGVEALHVPHGIVPALAYRVTAGGKTIVFSSDQNGNDEAFVEFSRDADVLVMHMPVPLGVSGAGRALHAPPDVIGQIANDADVETLLLSHFMGRSLRNLHENLAAIDGRFSGEIVLANDLECLLVN